MAGCNPNAGFPYVVAQKLLLTEIKPKCVVGTWYLLQTVIFYITFTLLSLITNGAQYFPDVRILIINNLIMK